mmetsp:Transcript_2864/g.10128  ORF Transcript_2864/g.10128 Transcript_2864/m.10128 type:complete len:227 (-) Transcript_2864:38-718(-)
MQAMKATGAGLRTEPPRSSCTSTVRLRHVASHATSSLFLPSVASTTSCASSTSSVSLETADRCTPLFSSCRRGLTALLTFLPTSLSDRKKFEPRWRISTGVLSNSVIDAGPARARFFAASMPVPLIPMIRTRMVTSLAMASMPYAPIWREYKSMNALLSSNPDFDSEAPPAAAMVAGCGAASCAVCPTWTRPSTLNALARAGTCCHGPPGGDSADTAHAPRLRSSR